MVLFHSLWTWIGYMVPQVEQQVELIFLGHHLVSAISLGQSQSPFAWARRTYFWVSLPDPFHGHLSLPHRSLEVVVVLTFLQF